MKNPNKIFPIINELRKQLKQISKGRVMPDQGLCSVIFDHLHNVIDDDVLQHVRVVYHTHNQICDIMTEWSLYSGSTGYPVPSTHSGVTASRLYDIRVESGKLYCGRYGKLRKQLAKFLADRLRDVDLKFHNKTHRWRVVDKITGDVMFTSPGRATARQLTALAPKRYKVVDTLK